MKNHEFAMRTALVARKAAMWSHDTLTLGAEHAAEDTSAETAERFCREIRETLSRIAIPSVTLKSNLSLAIQIAIEAHDGQIDRGGAPYILHPLRVMLAVQGDRERIAAVLHDVAEDCPEWPLERLRMQPFSGAVFDALDALTRRPGEDYRAFIDRCAVDPIARVVKLADLKDNQDLSRIKNPTEQDAARVRKYVDASMALLSAGNSSSPNNSQEKV